MLPKFYSSTLTSIADQPSGLRSKSASQPKSETPSQSKRQLWKEVTKEDITGLLDEVWFVDIDDLFYKIITRQATSGEIYNTLKLSKETLESLEWKENNGDISLLV